MQSVVSSLYVYNDRYTGLAQDSTLFVHVVISRKINKLKTDTVDTNRKLHMTCPIDSSKLPISHLKPF